MYILDTHGALHGAADPGGVGPAAAGSHDALTLGGARSALTVRGRPRGILGTAPALHQLGLPIMQAFLEENPAWQRFVFDSCVFGMTDPADGRPWLKRQGFLCSTSLQHLAEESCP